MAQKINGPSPASFLFLLIFSKVNTKYVHYKISPMTGFELRTPGFRSNRCANLATTTAHGSKFCHNLVPSCCLLLLFSTYFGIHSQNCLSTVSKSWAELRKQRDQIWQNSYHFGKFLSLWPIFEGLFSIYQNFELTLAIFSPVGQSFIVENGKILKK